MSRAKQAIHRVSREALTGPGGFRHGLGYRFLDETEIGYSRNQQCHQCSNHATEEWITPVDPKLPSMKGSPYAFLNSSTLRCCKQHGLRLEAGSMRSEKRRNEKSNEQYGKTKALLAAVETEVGRIVALANELLPAQPQRDLGEDVVRAYMRRLVQDTSDYAYVLDRLKELRWAAVSHLSKEEQVLLALKLDMPTP